MLNFLRKKKKLIIIGCKTDEIIINGKSLHFPTDKNAIIDCFGSPSRTLEKSKNYLFWDAIGIQCSFTDENNILSISFYQNKKDKSEYNTKKQFIGKLFLNDENITYKEFGKIALGNIAIHRLGSENENRFGFSIGINEDYKNLK